jgi:hypothetical protein
LGTLINIKDIDSITITIPVFMLSSNNLFEAATAFNVVTKAKTIAIRDRSRSAILV